MARGRPKKDTVRFQVRIAGDTFKLLPTFNPTLFTRTPTGELKFRHGAISRYVERLINQDLEQRKQRIEAARNAGATVVDDELLAFVENRSPNIGGSD